ncbi:GNAT family N-acetyltransferase [Streptomyces sp. cg36]|uniref:GNAT family N-acetyltransferase n=1 Tax=Streptomyces sp. cg36 TaxID=3238798 RepID=UPI0034E25969
MDLRLPYELIALFGESKSGGTAAPEAAGTVDSEGTESPGDPEETQPGAAAHEAPGAKAHGRADETADGGRGEGAAVDGGGPPPPSPRPTPPPPTPPTAPPPLRPIGEHLLDSPGTWGPVTTSVGEFQLVPVRVERDLALLSAWMNDPAVAAFWELAGPDSVTAAHLRPQLDGDGRSVPCLGVLGGVPMSYWEIYRADLDPLARHYPARPHDTGIHLLIGGVADRGRGVGTVLMRAVADAILDNRPLCSRVVAEPDLRNTPSVSAFLSAGFRFGAEVDLPDKRAALMVRDRALRNVL